MRIWIGLAGAAAIVAGLGALYGTRYVAGNAVAAACPASAPALAALRPLAQGEVAAFTVAERARVLPDLAFTDAEGRERKLSDWRGRTVLLNLWATWCVPCRREMPALDRLQAKLGGDSFEIVAVNLDTRGPEQVGKFLRDAGIDHLARYQDAALKVFQDLKGQGRAPGLPTSLLVGPDGCELGYLPGPAEWDSSDGTALVEAALKSRPKSADAAGRPGA